MRRTNGEAECAAGIDYAWSPRRATGNPGSIGAATLAPVGRLAVIYNRTTDLDECGPASGPEIRALHHGRMQFCPMDETSKIAATVGAAAKAAGEGHYALAEQHLREVVRLQEAAFGSVHPDLANTLNNLGVACEHAGRLDDAEDSYRRAYAIAQKVFPPGHPFVVRSEENLRDFCEARGRPFDLPAARPVAPVVEPGVASRPVAPVVDPVVGARPVAPLVHPPLPLADTPLIQIEGPPSGVPASRGPSRALAMLLAVVAIAAVLAWWYWPRLVPPVAPAQGSVHAPAARPVEAPATSPGAEANSARQDGPPVMPGAVAASPPVDGGTEPVAADSPVRPPVAPTPASSTVVRADVCRNFLPRGAEWRCDEVEASTTPGALVFFTRIRSPKPTRIEHRWYRGDDLAQRVELRVGANANEGYRTYSRNTVTAGEWRVELRVGDAVLHEQRFSVAAR
jgi:hypothetical protein